MTILIDDSPKTTQSNSQSPALELRGVTRKFGTSVAVDDVSFTLNTGTFLTMLGPAGSGKSTTLNMIAGFLEPSAGSILLRGRDIVGLAPNKRDIGMVFQNYSLFPHLSVARNVAFPLEVRGASRKEAMKKALEYLEIVDLKDRAKDKPRELSGGQQQRVALARSLVFGPDLLLMDEPLGALDRRLREEMQVSIKRITEQLGATVVFVTHDQEEALVMSDVIAIYNEGNIEQFGTSQSLYLNPASRFVAEFIGESNVLVGKVKGNTLVSDGEVFPLSAKPGARKFFEGSGAAIVVRPEQATLRCATSTDESARVIGRELAGTVTEVLYMGTAYRFFVHTDFGFDVEVRVRSHLPEAATQKGERVHVSWNPDDIAVVPA